MFNRIKFSSKFASIVTKISGIVALILLLSPIHILMADELKNGAESSVENDTTAVVADGGYDSSSPLFFTADIALNVGTYDFREVVDGKTFVEFKDGWTGGGEFKWHMNYQGFTLGTDLTMRAGYGNYSSESGILKRQTLMMVEPRVILGYDLEINSGLSSSIHLYPYTGFGYRYYYNDARPLVANAYEISYGYRRVTEYYYLPLGVNLEGEIYKFTPSLKSNSNQETGDYWHNILGWRFNIEYDLIMSAKHSSYLDDTCFFGKCASDTGKATGTIVNKLGVGGGFGIKSGFELRYNNISFGPYLDYWNLKRYSEVRIGVKNYVEPQNRTFDYGIKLRLLF